MSLVEHATRELELCGQTKEDPAYAATLVAAIAVFASYGHSGGSAMVAIEQLHILLNFGTLSPLTADPEEWIDRTGMSGYPMWQSMRNPSAFSEDGGATYYLLDEKDESGNRVMHESEPQRASDAGQYVSAGTREQEDQKRGEEEHEHG
jgi:hypothetical protein